MRVFLTGATGYVGGAVAGALRSRGHEVVALVRNPADAQRLRADGYLTVAGNMCEADGWLKEAAASDAIVHAAQLRFGKRVGSNWVGEAARADRAAMRRLVDAAERGRRCKAFVYTSGVSAFGDHGDAWIDESMTGSPGDIGRYHLAGERLALDAARGGLPALVLRPGLPYAAAGTFAGFFLAAAAKGKLKFVGGGDNFVPCEHLGDLGQAYALAVERPPVGQVVAVVDDEPLRMRELCRLVLAQFGGGEPKEAPAWLVGFFAGRPLAQMLCESYRVRNARAREVLGWSPRYVSLRDGLSPIVAEYRQTGGK